jgi:hypothetical protein
MLRRCFGFLTIALTLGSTAYGQVKLEYKITEGAVDNVQNSTKLHQLMTIMGMDVETNSENSSTTSVATGKRKSDGTLPFEFTIKNVKIKSTLPGGVELNLDSDDKDAKVDIPQLAFLADMIKVLKNSSYTIVVDDKNKFKVVEGAEKNIEKAAALPKQVVDGLKTRFENDRIKKDYEQAYGNLPEGLVREGETWERTETDDIGSGQTFTIKRKYEYKGTEKKGSKTLDKIAIKALDVTYSLSPNAELPVKVTKSELKIESSEGTILFDRELGTIVSKSEKTRIKGDMAMTINGQELPVKLDLTIDTNTTNERSSK